MDVPKFPAAPQYKWSSYIPDRKPKFKVHANRGLAYNAVMYELYGFPRGGVIYELQDGEWQPVFQYEQDMNCVKCGRGPLQKGDALKADYHVPREQTTLLCRACYRENRKF